MGSTVMMYILPMILGQSYHLGKEKPGIPLFSTPELEKETEVIKQYFTDSQYRMVENAAKVKDFLDISGKLSLKIKGGLIDVTGEGSYLKDSSSNKNGLEILIKFHYETITKTIPTYVKPVVDWSAYDNDILGTHYCRSITYGGNLIASVKVVGSSSSNLEKIKGAIDGSIKASGGSFSAEVKARLDKLTSDMQDSSSLEINYYASVPVHGVSYTIDGLLELVDKFPDHVEKVNDGIGNPLRMELFPLSSLKESNPSYFENRAINNLLEDIEDQFDDLRTTRKEIGTWTAELPPVVPENVQKQIEEFTNKVNGIFGIYIKTINELDISKNASIKPLEDTVKAYGAGDYVLYQKYLRMFRKLKREIYLKNPELRPTVGGARFVHWGRPECDTPETDVIQAGVSVTSETKQNGGSSEYLCSALNPDLKNSTEYFPKFDPDEKNEERNLLKISPFRYAGNLKKFENMKESELACAVCRSRIRSAVLMKPGDIKCPTNDWVKEYEGILMAPGYASLKGSVICVDVHMQAPKGNSTFGTEMRAHTRDIQEVAASCRDLPCKPYAEDKPIPCVVCTI